MFSFEDLFFSIFLIRIRVPKDKTTLSKWKESIGLGETELLCGFVCINHFTGEDLLPPTSTRSVSLKKEAIPSIFITMSDAHKTHNNVPSGQNEQNCSGCNDLKEQNTKIRTEYDVTIAKLQANIQTLKSKLNDQSKFFRQLAYANTSKADLIKSNELLKAKNSEQQQKLEALKVQLPFDIYQSVSIM